MSRGSSTSASAATDQRETFTNLVDQHRRELLVHCYRMVGSFEEAEDLVQETFLRAWRARDGFRGRAALRTWLYRIATNACLDTLTKKKPRLLPTVENSAHPTTILPPLADSVWLQPFPDHLLQPASRDEQPEAQAVAKETLQLAFLVALQHLPPRQRAVLVLRDVVGWSARETADMLDTTTASANSALQRARSTLRIHLPPHSRHEWSPSRNLPDKEKEVLDRFTTAVENADIDAIAELISEDAIGRMPPYPMWYQGRGAIIETVARSFDPAAAHYIGELRLLPTRANGSPAAALYRKAPGSSRYLPLAINVLVLEGMRIVELTSFVSPQLFAAFELPPELSPER